MEIRNLKTFLRVAALMNFTAAAQELGYSQANVSAQIKQLEEEVGAPLFNRIGRSITLTQYADELLPYARSIVSTAAQMESVLKSEDALGGTVHIGMVESLFDALAERLLLKYHRRFPRVQLEVALDATANLKESLRRGTLDMACLIDEPLLPGQWQIMCSKDVEIVVISNPSHPLASQKHITLEALASQEFVLMENSAPYGIQFQSELARRHIELRPFLTLQRSDMARKLVERGLFLSVLPRYSVADAEAGGLVRVLNVRGLQLRQTIQVVLHKDKVLTSQIAGAVAMLDDYLKEL